MLSLNQPKIQNASDLDVNVKDELDLPTNTVSSISWAPSGNNPTFAASDWASYIRIYNLDPDSSALTQQACFEAQSPCLSVKWHEDETTVFAGCADGSVKSYDFPSGSCSEIGRHEGPVKSVHWLSSSNALLTLSFDKTLRFWDPRQAKHVAGFRLDHQIYCSDVLDSYLAIGLSDAKCLFVDLPNVQAALERNIKYSNSPLGNRTQITDIKLCKFESNRIGFGVSGNDMRCNISYFDRDQQALERFDSVITFKARPIDEEKRLYPINCLGFHPYRGSQFLYTCGGHGKMTFWDIKVKNRIAQFDFGDIPVTQAKIDPSGKYIAYSIGYDWARGIQGYMSQPSKVSVHILKDRELEHRYQGDENYPIKY